MKTSTQRILATALFVLVALRPATAQPQLTPEITALLERLSELGRQADAALNPPPASTLVQTADEFQKALDKGGLIDIVPGVTLTGRFVARTSNTLVRGHGSTLVGAQGPALYVPPGVDHIRVEDLVGLATFNIVFQFGDNLATTQGTLDAVPRHITFVRVSVPTHRGKRAFEVNAADVELLDCTVADVYSPALQDSQAIGILNTPGPVLIDGGSYSAGSEVIMVGGDTMKIPGVIPSDITIRNTKLWRPLTWKTDGVKRAIKNLFELKTGNRVRVENVVMDGSWSDAQISFAIVLTPRNAGAVTDVVFHRITVRNVGGGLNIMGDDDKTITPTKTSGIVVKNSTFEINKTLWGGHGLFALFTRGPGTFEAIGNTITSDDGYARLTLVGDRVKMQAQTFTGNRWMTKYYNTAALPLSAPDGQPATWISEIVVTGNTIGDASSKTKATYPENTFVARSEFDALLVARKTRATPSRGVRGWIPAIEGARR